MSSKEIIECEIKHLPLKRIFDVCFSAAALILLLPLFLVIAIFTFFSSPGSLFYSQERIGRGGKKFRCYKFRTMHQNADEKLSELLKKNPALRQEWHERRKLKNDPRITRIGKFLRRTSLDELPQFWNVLKGDLSVVGPRPVVVEEVEQYFGRKAHKILSIRPGLTGIWQVSGRSNTSYETRIKMDEQYVDNIAFLLDVKLVLKTVPSLIQTRGAY